MKEQPYHLTGRVVERTTGKGIGGLRVEAWDKDLIVDDLVGGTVTDANGDFEMTFDPASLRELFPDRKPGLFFRVYRGQRLVRSTEDEVVWNVDAGETRMVIDLAPSLLAPQPGRLAEGHVVQPDGSPVSGVTVRAFQRRERAEQPLGEARTDPQGHYRMDVRFDAADGLLLRLYAPEGQQLAARSTLYVTGGDGRAMSFASVLRDVYTASPDAVEVVEVADGEASIPQTVAHTIRLRLLDRETGAALSGYGVEAFDLDAGEDPEALGFDVTDAEGRVAFVYTVYTTGPEKAEDEADRTAAGRRRVRLHVAGPDGEEIYRAEVRAVPDAPEGVDVAVPVPEAPVEPSPALEMLGEALSLDLPDELRSFLDEAGIATLDDVRRAGGLRRLDDLPVAADHAVVQALEAHARLSLLSPDVQVNETLITHGFDNLRTIADTPRDAFVETVHAAIDDEVALQLHGKAVAQSNFLGNVMAGIGTDAVNGFSSPYADIDPSKITRTGPCTCEDCKAAVSPLAYLADLLDYTLKRVRLTATAAPTLDDLTRLFHQPFDALPASCDEMQKKVRQVRLCIEVLRRYLKAGHLAAGAGAALDKAEAAYRLAVYQDVLKQLGTSYAEIRLARSADAKTRTALVGKLGIDLGTASPNHLAQLFLTEQEITEASLERLFGVVSTQVMRDPLSDGPALNDPQAQITRWNLTGVAWSHNTDPEGLVHVTLKHAAGGAYEVELYRDAARQQLVASGQTSSDTGRVALGPANLSGLSGWMDLAYTVGSTSASLSALPTFLCWRLQHLRTLWKTKDWPATETTGTRPLIDPDLIDDDDLRSTQGSDPAYALWQDRTKSLKQLLSDLQSARAGKTAPQGFEAVIEKAALGVPLKQAPAPPPAPSPLKLNTLIQLEAEYKKGASIDAKLKTYGLDHAAFQHLLRFHALTKQAGAQVLDGEWDDVYAILIEAKKRSTFALWRKEEKQKGLTLGPDFFKVRDTTRLTFPPATPKALPAWRATRTDRSAWDDALDARAKQQASVREAYWKAVDKAEEARIAALRDALVTASDAVGSDLQTKARWVTDNLLIDAAGDTCLETTRISQAIETLQNLLWSLRTGQLYDTYPTLTGTKEFTQHFGEEWKWIGSYATWRSAMFVFLYPENVLIPTLRTYQTPAFKKLVENVRKNRRLTPEHACQEARTYSTYFRDVCRLDVAASCHALTHLHEGTCRNRKAVERRTLFYTFAQGRSTKAVYWSAYDPKKQKTGYAQSFWEAVPGLENVTQIVGAHPYALSKTERYLFLFVCTFAEGEQKLVFTKYDLEQQSWDEETVDLELPDGVVRFEAVLNQRLDEWRPRLVIRDKETGIVYTRRLSPDGTGWEDDEFARFGLHFDLKKWVADNLKAEEDFAFDYFLKDEVKQLLAVHQLKPGILLLIGENKDGSIFAAFFRYRKTFWWDRKEKKTKEEWAWCREFNDTIPKSAGFVPIPWHSLGGSTDAAWVGSLQWKNSGDVYAVWKEGQQAARYRVITDTYPQPIVLAPKQGTFASIKGLTRIARDSGPPPGTTDRALAFQYGNAEDFPGPYRHTFTRGQDKRLKQGAAFTRLAPFVPAGPYEIVEMLSSKDRQARRKLIEKAFVANKDAPLSTLAYLEEAYYFVPVHLGLQLQRQKHYVEALDWFRTVYDYTVPEKGTTERRKISYLLAREEGTAFGYTRAANWLRDPLNPHHLAATRPNTYTRFTLQSIVRCLLAYADAEFTQDTTESLARARTLYLTVLDVLASKEIKQQQSACDNLVITLLTEFRNVLRLDARTAFETRLRRIGDLGTLQAVGDALRSDLASGGSGDDFTTRAFRRVDDALSQRSAPASFGATLEKQKKGYEQSQVEAFRDDDLFDFTKTFGAGKNGTSDEAPAMPWTVVPYVWLSFCISPNPVLRSLQLQAQLNLYKLRTCRNIAGMQRSIAPYAAPTDQVSGLPQIGASGQLSLTGTVTIPPTAYRYAVLFDRAKQLVTIAQQMEAALLAALEKYDAEVYNRLKARQDIDLAREQVQLQTLREQEAKDGVKLAELQKKRAEIQSEHYQQLITEGLTSLEEAALGMMIASAALQVAAAGLYTSAAVASWWTPGQTQGYLGQAASSLAASTSTTASILSMYASYERRAQEWAFQKQLAGQDILIGGQQVKIAQDHVRVVGQERTIAKLKSTQAKDTLTFLTKKFTSAELYDWMSGILEEVYSSFLQEATAVAKLAEGQLAFERQKAPTSYIQSDYWEAPSDGLGTTAASGKKQDRHGLTGSARLLQDLYDLDQYAFESAKRKLQLSKTISLAALSPVEFQRFREQGVLKFSTPMALFDRDFPGHYLRLIKRVRTSVIALIPPMQGIRATLSNLGISRAVVDGVGFQTVTVKRNPQSVALTAASQATGLFEDATGLFKLTQEADMLLPFEGLGVDTSWEFRLPQAANPFDFTTIADVLVTIDYTALDSSLYRQQVLQALSPSVSADRAFSFRHHLADAWYDLHHPELSKTPMSVTFETRRADFPPNLEGLTIQELVLYVAEASGKTSPVTVNDLRFEEKGKSGGGVAGGQAITVDGVISTRRGNAGSWTTFTSGTSPVGTWTLELPDTAAMRDRFKNEEITDLLFVITYTGRTPAWPA